MKDESILKNISRLIDEEHELRAGPDASGQERLKEVADKLDQCWDLLRQRRAKREFGQDPDTATARDIDTVEHYSG